MIPRFLFGWGGFFGGGSSSSDDSSSKDSDSKKVLQITKVAEISEKILTTYLKLLKNQALLSQNLPRQELMPKVIKIMILLKNGSRQVGA